MTVTERATLFDEAFLRRLETLELASRRLTAGRMKGERRSIRRGQSVEFADYRNYTAGDDLRQLDWNVYARLEKLFVKLFVEEEDVTVHVLVDASASMDFGDPNKLDFARRAGAALAYLGLAHLDRVSVAFLGDGRATMLRPLRGKARVFEVFGRHRHRYFTTGLTVGLPDFASFSSRWINESRPFCATSAPKSCWKLFT